MLAIVRGRVRSTYMYSPNTYCTFLKYYFDGFSPQIPSVLALYRSSPRPGAQLLILNGKPSQREGVTGYRRTSSSWSARCCKGVGVVIMSKAAAAVLRGRMRFLT